MSITRRIQASITGDLEQKMVFLAGARQVGKTTLAKQILEASRAGLYLSWDRRDDRRTIRDARWRPTPPSWCSMSCTSGGPGSVGSKANSMPTASVSILS